MIILGTHALAQDSGFVPLNIEGQTDASLASQTDDSLKEQIRAVTHKLMQKEIDFERFYLNYKLVGNKDPRWRRARYFLLQQAAVSLAAVATGIPIIETGKNLKHPSNVRGKVFQRSSRIGITGVAIGGGSDIIELSSNAMRAVKNKLQHKDPKAIRKQMVSRVKEIDDLLAQRQALCSRLQHPQLREIADSEGKLLKLFRNWCIYEFADIYADVKAYQSSNNVYYAMDLTGNSIGGAAYLLGIKSLTKPEFAKPSAVTGIVSDSFYIASAPVSAVAYKILYNRAYKSIAKELKLQLADPEPEAKAEMERLKGLLNNASVELAGPMGAHARLEILALWSDRYDEYVKKNEEELRHLSRVAQQNNISGPLISSSYLATDIMGAIAAFRLQEHPRGTNSLGFAGSISSTAGSAAFFMLSNQQLFSEIKFEKHLRKEGKLPEQLIDQRLTTLNELDKRLASSSH